MKEENKKMEKTLKKFLIFASMCVFYRENEVIHLIKEGNSSNFM